jgi:uncharacterized protein DUF2092
MRTPQVRHHLQDLSGGTQFIAVLSNWDFATPLSDALFSADLPPDAELITFLKAAEPKTKE